MISRITRRLCLDTKDLPTLVYLHNELIRKAIAYKGRYMIDYHNRLHNLTYNLIIVVHHLRGIMQLEEYNTLFTTDVTSWKEASDTILVNYFKENK